MAGRNLRMIYAHPASRDGFQYFYVSHMRDSRNLILRYKHTSGQPQELALGSAEMLKFLSDHRDNPSEEWPFEVTDPAFRIVKTQVDLWEQEAT